MQRTGWQKTPSTIAIAVIEVVRSIDPKKISIPIANFSTAATVKTGMRNMEAYAL